MAENKTTEVPAKSKRELFGERLKKRYPDREFADDEELFGQVSDDYDNYDNQIGQYRKREKELTDLFAKYPRSARFLTDMAKGEDPWISTVRRLGIDGITDIINNPDKQEEYAKANSEFVERLAREEELENEFQQNFAESMQNLERIQQERQLGDETVNAAMELVMRIANEAIVGKFTDETINMALNAINHDADVQNARTEGAVAGRNEKIDEKLRKPKQGDGMPNLAGSNNAPTRKRTNQSMFDLADEAR